MVRSELEFRILGSLEIGGDGRLLPLRGGKQRALLTVLLLHANETLSTEAIIDRLWGDEPPDRAANALQVYVSQLRKLLPPETLVTQPPGYVLRIDPDQLDLSRFERLAAEGRTALDEGDPREAAQKLRKALDLWRGEPLADVAFEPFAQAEVMRLEELRLATVEDRIDADLALGRQSTLVGELESLVQQHPLGERLRAQLMLALYRSGRQAEALEEYQSARHTLVDELGIEPGPALQALEKAILLQDPALEAPAAVSAGGPRSDSLPVASTPLVGREEELETALALAGREDVRLLTFTGPGGIGKTRLALEVARRLAGEFDDGARFVALAPISDPLLVGPTIAEVLGASAETLERELSDRSMLLLLDSLEQVLTAAPLLTTLLSSAPRLKILVASRAVLRLSGEHEFQVPPLAPESATALFLQRAQAVKHDFEPEDDDDLAAVTEICARLDGLPLAIELAAARSKLLAPRAMLSRLSSRLDLLVSGARDAPERQQTLRTTIDWSYDLLEESDQRLFARLAIFVGGCTLESVEAVCADPEAGVLEALGSLVDKSLLRESGGRFWMLDTVREYALERLAAGGDEEQLGGRHMLHFLELAEQSTEQLVGPNQAAWMRRLALEHDNLRAAIASALARGEGEVALRFGATLWRFWEFHGHFAEGGRTLEAMLAEPTASAPSIPRARVLNGAGVLAAERGDLEAAQGFFEESMRLSQEFGDERRAASSLMNLGNLALFQSDIERARALYEESTSVFRRTGDHDRLAVALEDLGLVAHLQGDLDGAEAILRESIETARATSNPHSVSSASRELGRVRLAQGANAEAAELLAESLALVRAADEPIGLAYCLEAFAGLAVASGAASDAAALFGAAQALRDELGSNRPPDQVPWYERYLDETRAELGDEFVEQFDRGRVLPVEGAIALALSISAPA